MTKLHVFLYLPLILAAVTPGCSRVVWSTLPLRMIPLALMALGMALFGWMDVYHLTLAAIVMLVFTLSTKRPARCDSTPRTRESKLQRNIAAISGLDATNVESIRAQVGREVAKGILVFLIFTLASLLLSLLPGLQQLAFDRDRPVLELQLETLEQATDWSAAVDLITARLERRTSRPWRRALTERLYRSLIGAGSAAGGEHAEAFFRQAFELAHQNGLDSELAKTHLDQLHLRDAADLQAKAASELAHTDQERQLEVRHLSTQIAESQRKCDELAGELTVSRQESKGLQQNLAQAQADLTQTQNDHAQATMQLLVGWGDSPELDYPLRSAKYREAESLAKQHGFPTASIDARLAELQHSLACQQPAPLPSDVRAVVQRIDATSFPPLTIVDLTLQLPTGESLTGLAIKDYQLRYDNGTPVRPLVVDMRTAMPDALQIVLLLDCSNSTKGPSLAAALAGAAGMLKQFQGLAHVRVLAFGTSLSVIADWTSEPATTIAQLEKLTIAGNTALLLAIGQAALDLADRKGPRAIILFTDGHDTVGGPSLADLIDRCQKARIVVHVIALETAELDRNSLAQITLATGGLLLSASKADELPKRFRQAAVALQHPYYRIVFENLAPRPWEIVVGGLNAVRISNQTDEPRPTSKQRR